MAGNRLTVPALSVGAGVTFSAALACRDGGGCSAPSRTGARGWQADYRCRKRRPTRRRRTSRREDPSGSSSKSEQGQILVSTQCTWRRPPSGLRVGSRQRAPAWPDRLRARALEIGSGQGSSGRREPLSTRPARFLPRKVCRRNGPARTSTWKAGGPASVTSSRAAGARGRSPATIRRRCRRPGSGELFRCVDRDECGAEPSNAASSNEPILRRLSASPRS
jgi:hypothetical protein